ncbi:MAG: hypothetical protein MZV64_25085 [Ignavibacteriales bacterium]|nr:hypothetical protein [Ignavibacteriales bacterium]
MPSPFGVGEAAHEDLVEDRAAGPAVVPRRGSPLQRSPRRAGVPRGRAGREAEGHQAGRQEVPGESAECPQGFHGTYPTPGGWARQRLLHWVGRGKLRTVNRDLPSAPLPGLPVASPPLAPAGGEGRGEGVQALVAEWKRTPHPDPLPAPRGEGRGVEALELPNSTGGSTSWVVVEAESGEW